MAMRATFYGTVEASLDSKGRAGLPADYRENFQLYEDASMQSRLYFAQSEAIGEAGQSIHFLIAFGHDTLSRMAEALAYSDDTEALKIEEILEQVSMVRFDNAGRFSIGSLAVKALDVKDKVLFRGFGTAFEIWNPAQVEKVNRADLGGSRKLFRKLVVNGRGE